MTTPFYGATVGYAGALPDDPPLWDTVLSRRLWLGRAGNLIELPSVAASGYAVSESRGESPHTLINGATAVHLLPSVARSWTLSWPLLAGRDWQVVAGFQRRAFGNGPWAFLNPEGTNRLTYKQSMCLDASQWVTTSGSVATDTTPGYIAPGGTLLWTPAASGGVMGPGTVSGSYILPDVSRSPVHVPAEAFTVSFWVQAPTGTVSVSARVVGRAATGSGITTLTGSAVTVGTNWQQIAVVAAPGAFDPTCLYVMPQLVTNDGKAVRFSCPSASYTSETVDWAAGGGVPRVVLAAGLDRSISPMLTSSVSLPLSEYIVGVA